MKTYNKIVAFLIAAIFILAGIYLYSATVLATEDDTFSRPLYSYQQANEGAIDHITFNSIKVADTDTVWAEANGLELPLLGNETNFVGAREDTGVNAGSKNVWEGTEITAEDGKTYIVRLYVHNNSQKGENGTAEDTQVRFHVPYGSGTSVTVDGELRASNATPNQYLDDVTFKSKDGTPFSLQYIYGSAQLENGGFASSNGVKLPDTVTNQGNNSSNGEWTLIGYDALDGRIPGCYQYINYVAIMVRVVYDYDFTVETKVRLADNEDKTWYDSVEAQIGDKVEFQFQYLNTSNYNQAGVVVRDLLPSNLRYVEGSTIVYNGNHPNGVKLDTDDVINGGVNIGSYDANANAYIRITAEVVDDNLACGSNTLINWAQVRVGYKTLQDNAQVHVQNSKRFIINVTILIALIIVCLVLICIYLYRIRRWKQAHK